MTALTNATPSDERRAPTAAPRRVFPLAGYAALFALATLVLSAVALALFFGGVGYIFGPINDVLVAITLVLLVPAVLAVRQLSKGAVGAWFSILTVLAVLGMVGAAVGQLLLVLRVISLQTSFVTGGIGVLPLIAWIAAVGVIALRRGVLSRQLGWWSAAFVAISAVAALGVPVLPTGVLYALGVPILVALVGWILTLARELLAPAD